MNTGITNFSLIFCFKIFFFVFFIFLNLVLLFLENLDRREQLKQKPETPLQAGIHPQIKNIASGVVLTLGVIASIIAIKNEVTDQNKYAKLKLEAQALLDQSKEETRKVLSDRATNRFIYNLQLTNLNNSVSTLSEVEQQGSEIMKKVKALNERKKNGENVEEYLIKALRNLSDVEIIKHRAFKEVQNGLAAATKFKEELYKKTDDQACLDLINKSSILNFEDLLELFESFDGLTKVSCIMIFTSYFIMGSLITITINLHGDYLLNRFQIAKKYPRLAVFIKYKQKIGHFYVLSSILYIFIFSLMNFFFGISILTILYT
jgi:uncharacterized protein (UPF0333 family)